MLFLNHRDYYAGTRKGVNCPKSILFGSQKKDMHGKDVDQEGYIVVREKSNSLRDGKKRGKNQVQVRSRQSQCNTVKGYANLMTGKKRNNW